MSSLIQVGLHQILKFWAENAPDHLAIAAPDRSPLSYGQLWQQINDLVIQFNSLGVGRNDRVAIALPNSPEMAVAFLASASCATCAPLNPGYKAPEFDFYLRDLQAKVLIVQAGVDSPAIAIAQSLHIPIIELAPITDAPAGVFTLHPREIAHQSLHQSLNSEQQGFAAPEDIALVLHTSGTTSRPKIVPLSHRNLCTSAANISATLQLTQSDRCLNVMPLFHIHGLIACLLSSLKAGGSVVCSPGFYAPKFFDWLEEFQPTWYSCVPTMHQAILARSAAHQELIDRTPLRFLRSSSAALAPAVMAEIEAVFKAPVIEAYGMTEAAHQMASNPLPPGQRKPGSVGLAAGPELSIMDEAGNLLPLGEIGEIVIRGENVTIGYENNPTANATAFTNSWFRTGDQGYLDQDNYLFIKDRIKEIINRGGEKISPREVDEIIFSHPAIAQAVTFAMPHPQLGEEVAVAVVLQPDRSVTEREIQEFAAIQLADFKIPRRVIFLEEIPKGATGKLQRIGLAEKLGLTTPKVTGAIASMMDQSTAFAPPQPSLESNLEATLAEICRDVLRVEAVGMGDNFFALGGDSLLAAQVINRVRSQLHRDLSIVSFWQHQTLGDITQELAEKNPILTLAIKPQTQTEYPLSAAQVQMWLLEQITPDMGVYNQPLAIQLPQQVDLGILHQSLQEVIRRHTILRSQFLVVEGEPRQQILPDLTIDLPILELPISPIVEGADQRGRSQDLVREYMQTPFDLAQGGLIRGAIVQPDEGNQILLLVIHHIIFDGWSRGIFLQELNALYNAFAQGRPSPLSELPIQYTDFALWQQLGTSTSLSDRDRVTSVTSASLSERSDRGQDISDRDRSKIAFWEAYLEGAPPLLELPIDYPRSRHQTSSGAEEKLLLSIDLGKSLATLSRQANVTLFVTLLTAFGTLLHRYTGVRDLVIGCPVAGRNHLETENLIGVFINTLPLRLQIEGDLSFSDLLQQIQANSLQALNHQDLSLEKLIKVLQPERNSSHQNLFQVGFIFEPPMPDVETGVDVTFDLARDFFVHNGRAKFDLSLIIEETPAGIVSSIEYSTDLFQEATITRMLGHWQTLLEGIVADPTQSIATLPLLTPAERQTLLIDWNNTQRAYPQDQCIHQLFAAQVERSPDAVAVVYQDQELTYGELNERSNQLAHYLQSLGVQPEVLVGICVDRSLDMVIGLLGILKAGGAYVPLDPVYPLERLEYMITDAQISILLTQQNLVTKLPVHQAQVICLDTEAEALAKYSSANPVTSLESNNLAYVIYTSGSTGKPKGVMIQHRSVVNYIQAGIKEYQLQSSDRILQFASYSFDTAVEEVFSTLSAGATLVLRTDEMLSSIATFLATCQAWQLTVLDLPTAYWHQLVSALARAEVTLPPAVRLVIIGGERAIPAQVKQWQETVGSYPVLINGYGPTEASIAVTLHDISVPNPLYADREVPIGRPIQNCRLYILDQNLQPVPIGIAGELHIGGEVLARGYLNRPELTAEKFISNHFDNFQGGRLYKTGDLVRYLPDGNIEYLGRIDNQVKLRGFRIELGEIEAVLAQHQLIVEAVVVNSQKDEGNDYLSAYIVLEKSKIQIGEETFTVTSCAEAPSLKNRMEQEHLQAWPKFFQGNQATLEYWPQLYNIFPEYQFAILDQEQHIVAVGNTIPLIWSGENNDLPSGWDDAIVQGFANQNNTPNTLCVLAGIVSEHRKGTGMSYELIKVMAGLAGARNLKRVIIPVRPTMKTQYPDQGLEEYVQQTRSDGLIYDAWLRVHHKLGGQIIGYAHRSQLITGSIKQWEAWTGAKFPTSGQYVIPGAMQRVTINLEKDIGTYDDLSVWVTHQPRKYADNFLSNLSVKEIRNHLLGSLPDYMVPAMFRFIEAIPLTPNGKIDRRALPAIDFQPTASVSNYLAPQNAIEEAIAQIWAEVLQIEKAGVNDNFFDLGGHSLSAIRVMTRLQEKFSVALSLRSLFQFPTIATLASQLEALLYVQEAKTNHDLDTEYEEFEL